MSIRGTFALLALALLIGLYGYVFTAIADVRLHYALIACLALVLVLAGPMYAFFRYKARLPWPTILTRVLVAAIFVITAMPIITAAGLFFGAIGIAQGFSLLYQGQLLRGFLVVIVWTFAFYGLVTLWSLARHFWRKPSDNPPVPQLKRNLLGLGMGILAVPALWMPQVVGRGNFEVLFGLAALFTLPPALLFGSLLAWNGRRSSRTERNHGP